MIKNISIISTVMMLLLSSNTVFATDTTETCANGAGIVIKGKNGAEYCLSKLTMNWWTALGWCQAIGKTPISYPDDCRCVGNGCGTEMVGCPNLAIDFNAWAWANTPSYSAEFSYTINLKNGEVNGNWVYGTRSNKLNSRALCK